MSLRTNRVLPLINAVSRNVLQKPASSKPFMDDLRVYEEPEYYEDEPMPELETGHIQIIHNPESEEFTLDELIDRLESVAKKELNSGIGLRERSISEENLIIGNKAKMFADELSRNPKKKTIVQAVEFMGTLSLIEELEKIERERTRKIGLRMDEMPEEDKEFGKRAEEFKNGLIFNPNKQNIKLTVKFLELAELINELEDISYRRVKTEIGLIVPEIKDQDLILSAGAQNLANILKLTPTKKNIQTALEFINVINLLESGQISLKIEEKATKPEPKSRVAEPDYQVAA